MKLIKAKSSADMSRKAANILSAQVILKSNSVLGLATGSSPVGIYNQLVEWYEKGDVDFSQVTTVNLDEYWGLDKNHPQSYRYFMDTHFFDKINIKKENTHVPNGMAIDPMEECLRYDRLIESLGGIDMQLLGIGHNGHIAFNEPNFAFEMTTHIVNLSDETKEKNSRFFGSLKEVPTRAITMGLKSIMQAKSILLVAFGKDKKEILHRALYGAVSPEVPASVLQLHPNLTVIEACDD